MLTINCSKCGRFVGKDGNPDIMYDHYNGGYEVGYPLCGRCLREKNHITPHSSGTLPAPVELGVMINKIIIPSLILPGFHIYWLIPFPELWWVIISLFILSVFIFSIVGILDWLL